MGKAYWSKWIAWASMCLLAFIPVAQAATVTLATAPLANSTTSVVRPNIMYVLDDSGSMFFDYTPDYIDGCSGGGCNFYWHSGVSAGGGSPPPGGMCWGVSGSPASILGADQAVQCNQAYNVPWATSAINYQYYNPAVRYQIPLQANGTTYPASLSAPATATGVSGSGSGSYKDVFIGGAPTINLTGNNFTHQVWCKTSAATPTAADPTSGGNCRENLDTSDSTNLWPSNVFSVAKTYNGPPFYFNMLPFEYCTDSGLKTCVVSPVATVISGVAYSVPSIFRWCASYTPATSTFSGCQRDRDATHFVPNYLGRVVTSPAAPVKANADLTVTGVVSGLKITSLTINGINIFIGATTITAGAFSTPTTIAQAICTAVRANTAVSGYDCPVAPLSNTLTITANTAGSAPNGLPVVVVGPNGTTTINSQGSISVVDATSSKSIDQIVINVNPLLSSSIVATGSVLTTSAAICAAINAGPANGVYSARSGSSSWGSCPGAAGGLVEIQRLSADTVDNGAPVVVSGPPASAVATKASGTLTLISTSGATRVDDITVGGTSILTGTKPVLFADGTLTTANAATLAARVGNGFTATASSGVITVTSTTTGAAPNGQALLLQSSAAPATGVISVAAGANVPADLGGITAGGTTIVGHLAITDITDGSASSANAQTITDAINASGTGFSASAAANVVTVTSPLGTTYNGAAFTYVAGTSGPRPSWTFNITNATTNGKLLNRISCGGVDTVRPNFSTTGTGSSNKARVNNLGTSLQTNAQNGYVYSCPSIGGTVPPAFATCTVTGPAGNAACSGFNFTLDGSISVSGMNQVSPGGTLAWQNFAPLLSTVTTLTGGKNIQSSAGSAMSGGGIVSPGTIGVVTTNMTSGSAGTGTIITNATLPDTLFLADGTDASAKTRADTGNLQRTDIVSSNSSYPKATGPTGRTDCAGTVCNYSEELQNFANWYTYYSTRITMMKTISMLAFSQLGGNYRVGFDKISNNTSTSVVRPIAQFLDSGEVANQRNNWWSSLSATVPGGATPLRAEVSKVGRYFSGKLSSDPLQYSCQQNFTLLVTDGYWNEPESTAIQGIDGTDIGNVDNNAITASRPFYDGQVAPTACPALGSNRSGPSSCRTLADVTYYYYNTDLRDQTLWGNNLNSPAALDVSQNNVPASTGDSNTKQHMNFFSMGLGVPGLLNYRSDYQTAGTGDYFDILQGTRNWPAVNVNDQTGSDDLWHAAVNGHGKYFNATNAQSVSDGLNESLTSIQARVGAASAAATSNLQPVPGDNFAYVASYETVDWVGDLQARNINLITGDVSSDTNCGVAGSGCLWSAQAQLDGKTWSTRAIYMGRGSTSGTTPALFSSMSVADQATFLNPTTLSQYATAVVSYPTQVTSANLLRYLGGDRSLEVGGAGPQIWRGRSHVLGDIVDSQPVFVKTPAFTYLEAINLGYTAFKSGAAATRQAVVYVSANDGMLHAFNATTGDELWSFVPTSSLAGIKNLADVNYSHQFYVDGPTTVGDVNFGGGSSDWHTILVAGLGGGGSAYFALDITDPLNPKYLWEFTDTNLGSTFGNPSINKLPSGQWAVLFTSGYNNTSSGGDGGGHLYAVAPNTGALIAGYPLNTGIGSAASPSNLGKISAWVDNLSVDNTATHVYGGDLNGSVWRFDLTAQTAFRLARLRNASNQAQPISTRPELALVGSARVVYVGTGEYLGVPDLSDTRTQSLYAIKDTLGLPNFFGGSSQVTWNPRTDTDTILAVPGTSVFLRRTLLETRSDGSVITDGPGNVGGNNIRKICRGAGSQVGPTSSNNCINETGPSMDWMTYGGWIIDFPDSGERMNVDMNLTLGTLTFPTNIPASSACTSGGFSWLNFVDFNTGLSVANTIGLAGVKISNALIVGINVIKLPSGAITAIVTTSDYHHQSVPPPVVPTTFQGKRSLWRELEVY